MALARAACDARLPELLLRSAQLLCSTSAAALNTDSLLGGSCSTTSPSFHLPPLHSAPLSTVDAFQHIQLPGRPDGLLPQLCAVPKKKLTVHRRGNRRVWYKLDRVPVAAKCRHCGQVGMPHEFFAGKGVCTGECVKPSEREYPPEYKPPC